MDVGGATWIVVADSEAARVFAEPVRAGAVHELAEEHMSATGAEGVHAGHHAHGGPSHVSGPEHFLHRVAARIDAAAAQHRFDSLVVMAPPHALGVLRAALSEKTRARIEGSDPHDRLRADAESVRTALRAVRARG